MAKKTNCAQKLLVFQANLYTEPILLRMAAIGIHANLSLL